MAERTTRSLSRKKEIACQPSIYMYTAVAGAAYTTVGSCIISDNKNYIELLETCPQRSPLNYIALPTIHSLLGLLSSYIELYLQFFCYNKLTGNGRVSCTANMFSDRNIIRFGAMRSH